VKVHVWRAAQPSRECTRDGFARGGARGQQDDAPLEAARAAPRLIQPGRFTRGRDDTHAGPQPLELEQELLEHRFALEVCVRGRSLNDRSLRNPSA
jgi:hypothetical protein